MGRQSAISGTHEIRNSKNKSQKMKLSRIARDEPGRPGKYPQGSPKAISGSKKAIWVKSGNPTIWPSGPSPGTSGASRNPLDLPSRAARISPGAPGNRLTWCEAPDPKEIVAGLSEARGNSFSIPGKFLRQSWVGNRKFQVRTKFEKSKIFVKK